MKLNNPNRKEDVNLAANVEVISPHASMNAGIINSIDGKVAINFKFDSMKKPAKMLKKVITIKNNVVCFTISSQ